MIDIPFQAAFDTDLPAFFWLQSRSDLVADFGLWMTAIHDGRKTWLNGFDFEGFLDSSGPVANETPVFVDAGGGIGSQCALVKEKLPELRGRVILQDQPVVIEHSFPLDGMEKQAFDFWDGQPIEGVRAYYLRNVLHDFPDERCIVLLKNTIAALGPESLILKDEMIVPNAGAHLHATEQDMVMMTTLASKERTPEQWDSLLSAAGLEILRKETYPYATADSIQVVVPQDRQD